MRLKSKKGSKQQGKQKRNVCGANHSGKPDQMPVDDSKPSNATDVMGMARGKVGDDERQRTARDPNGASTKVEGTPVPVLSATLPTEDAIWSFLRARRV